MAVVRKFQARVGRISLWCKVAKRIGWNEKVYQGIWREITFQGVSCI